jgi:putative flippase GtrA
MDAFHHVFGREAYRCRECRIRFYGAKSAALETSASDHSSKSRQWSFGQASPSEHRRLMRRLTLFAIFALAFIIFWFFLRFLTAEHGSSDQTLRGSSYGVSSCEPSEIG